MLLSYASRRRPAEGNRLHIFYIVLRLVLVVAAAIYLGGQVKKPTGPIGRLFARTMNATHSALTDWALTQLQIPAGATALDVGCGGGRTIGKLAQTAHIVYGVDYASGSVAASREKNQQLISQNRVGIEQASVSNLPFPNNLFDVVTAIETQYYWPDMVHDMQEILRVLKPGGMLMIAVESYRGGSDDWILGPVMRLLGARRLSVDDQRALFREAGFTDIRISEERHKGWLCVIGSKPQS